MLNSDFFKWLVYMFVKAKGLKICQTILQKFVMLINGGKNVFSHPLPWKKNCCEICNIYFEQIFFILFFLFYSDCFLLYTKLKIYEDSYSLVF